MNNYKQLADMLKKYAEESEAPGNGDGKLEGDALVKELNYALNSEWLAAYQYWMASKISRGKGKADCDPEFELHYKEELDHAEKLADRINILSPGSVPFQQDPKDWEANAPAWTPVTTSDVVEQLNILIESEQTAITLYKRILDRCDDPVTKRIVRGILADEEEHKYDLDMLLQDIH